MSWQEIRRDWTREQYNMHMLVWLELKETEARAMDNGYSGDNGQEGAPSLLGPSAGAGGTRRESSVSTIHGLGPVARYPHLKSAAETN